MARRRSSKGRDPKKTWQEWLVAWSSAPLGKWFIGVLLACLIYTFLWIIDSSSLILRQSLERISISHSFPQLWDTLFHANDVSATPLFVWMIDYSAAVLACSAVGTAIAIFMIQLVLVPPAAFHAEAGGRLGELTALKLPPVDHLRDFVYTCKGLDLEKIQEEHVFLRGLRACPAS